MSDPAGNRTSLAGVPSVLAIAQGAKSSGLLSVAVGGQVISVQAARDVTFAGLDRVVLVKADGIWVAVARLDTAATGDTSMTNPPPVPPKPVVTKGSKTFTATTRSRQGGKWRTDNDDVYQGQYGGNGNHTGCAFYGNGPRSLAGATVTAASIKVRRKNAGGITAAQTTTLRLVTEKTKPSGAPTLTSSTTGPSLRWGQTATFSIPVSWAQAMVDGTSGGLAIFDSGGSPYVILDGRGSYGASFALTIAWRR